MTPANEIPPEAAAEAEEKEKNAVMGGWLYLVATPIGNLADLSPRALKVFREADIIAAEDTRTTAKLLSLWGVRGKSMIPYHRHNDRSAGEKILEKLKAGYSVALASDAGTPAVSDPGEALVKSCAEAGIPVTALPGCCAAVAALTLSGLSTGRFAFEGFLPSAGSKRKERLQAISREERTVVLYCAPHRLREDLEALLAAAGDRRIALCRELTKRNEEIFRTTLSAALQRYAEEPPRGEYVLVMEGREDAASRTALPEEGEEHEPLPSPASQMDVYLARGLSRMDAMKAAAKDRGISKGAFYRLLLEEQKSRGDL